MKRTLEKLPEVMQRTTMSRSAIYDAIKKGAFPAPVRLTGSSRAVAWRTEDIDAWIDSLGGERGGTHE